MNEPAEKYDVSSTGELVAGLPQEQVIKKLRKRFTLSEERAFSMLKKGKVLKRDLTREQAENVVKLFSSLGLKVTVKNLEENTEAESERRVVTPTELRWSILHKFLFCLFGGVLACLGPLLLLAIVVLWGAGIWAVVSVTINGLQASFLLSLFTVFLIPIILLQVVILVAFVHLLVSRYPVRQGYILHDEEAPELFALVGRICQRYKIKDPLYLQLNNEVDIDVLSAGALMDVFKGRITLNIGLPVASGMTARNFSGVLAYSLALNSSVTLRVMYFMVSRFERYLETIVYQKNTWDTQIQSHLKTNRNWVYDAPLKCIEWFLVQFRTVISMVLIVHECISRPFFSLTQRRCMQFEMDLIGAAAFQKNCRTMADIIRAREVVYQLNRHAWMNKKLFRSKSRAVSMVLDMPEIILAEQVFATKSVKDYHVTMHPLDGGSISTDECEGRDVESVLGEVAVTLPAEKLFEDFDEIGEQVTIDSYHESYIEGKNTECRYASYYGDVPEKWMTGNEEIFEINQVQLHLECALLDYMGVKYEHRMLELDEPMNPELIKMNWQSVVDWVRERLISYREDHTKLQLIEHDLFRKHYAQVLNQAGVGVSNKNIGQGSGYHYEDLKAASGVSPHASDQLMASREFEEHHEATLTRLYVIDRMLYQRLQHTIHQMSGEERRFAQQLLSYVQDMSDLRPLLTKLNTSAKIIARIYKIKPWIQLRKLTKNLNDQVKHSSDVIDKLLRKTADVTVYSYNLEALTLSDLLMQVGSKSLSESKQFTPREMAGAIEEINHVIRYQYAFMLGHLCAICGKVELDQGVRPLKVVGRQSDDK